MLNKTLNIAAPVLDASQKVLRHNVWISGVTYAEEQLHMIEDASFPLLVWEHGSLNFGLMDFIGSMLVCYQYKKEMKSPKSWFEVYVACILTRFGGTTLTGLFLGQSPSWMMSNVSVPAFTLAFWLFFCYPYETHLSHIFNSNERGFKKDSICLFLLKLGAAISSGFAITSNGVDKVLINSFHMNHIRIAQSVFLCIICGTISACGGGVISDWLNFRGEHSFTVQTKGALFQIEDYTISSSVTRSFILATTYYMLITPHHLPWVASGPLLLKSHAQLLVVVLQLCHCVLSELFSIDVFCWLASIVRGNILFIPSVIEPESCQDNNFALVDRFDRAQTKHSITSKPMTPALSASKSIATVNLFSDRYLLQASRKRGKAKAI